MVGGRTDKVSNNCRNPAIEWTKEYYRRSARGRRVDMCTYIRVSAKKKTLVKCRHWDECNSMRSTRRCRLAINIYQRQLALEGRPESKHWRKGNNCRERLTLSLNPMDDAKSSPKCERREVQLVPREEGPAGEEASWRA